MPRDPYPHELARLDAAVRAAVLTEADLFIWEDVLRLYRERTEDLDDAETAVGDLEDKVDKLEGSEHFGKAEAYEDAATEADQRAKVLENPVYEELAETFREKAAEARALAEGPKK